MAFFKNSLLLKPGIHAAFNQTYPPGALAPLGGIYRCTGCSHEIAIADNNQLPPQNHHMHGLLQGHICWQLVACPEYQEFTNQLARLIA